MNPKAIVFDLDDTLYLERDYVRSGFQATGEWFRVEFGMPDFAQRAEAAFRIGGRGKIFDGVLISYGITPEPELVGRLVEVYRNHSPSIELLEDARICLNALRGTRPLALITDGPSRTQRSKIHALGIASFFDSIVVTGDFGSEFSKPHPRAFLCVEESLGINGERLVYVADNPMKDFQAPRKLGWQTIQVLRKHGIYANVIGSAGADLQVPDLVALLPLLP
jgi:putative hydrolase of the HAD superfamily